MSDRIRARHRNTTPLTFTEPTRELASPSTAAVARGMRIDPLPQPPQTLAEPGFGHDFSQMPVHADGVAPEAGLIPIQRQAQAAAPVLPVAGLALGVATFAMSLRPSGSDTFGNTNVQFRYARDTPGPMEPIEIAHVVFHLNSIKGLGTSWAFLKLLLRYDGQNIISAYTYPDTVRGYEGGILGSEAAVNFSAVEASRGDEPIARAYLLVQGFNNPSGPGFQRFRARILVTGDGRVEPLECTLTEGDGVAQTSPWCTVGW
jgi:hypothetical protein